MALNIISRLVITSLVYYFIPSPSFSAEGGYSNYVPGSYGDFGMALAPAEQWTLRNDIYYYNADASRAPRNGNIETDLDITFLMNFTTILYKSDLEIFGGTYAAGVFIPFSHIDIDTDVSIGNSNTSVDDSTTGLGDIAFIPIALYWNLGNIHTSLTQIVVAPTGDYDVNDSVNTSLNYWSFDSNFALTYLNIETGRELSLNIGHIYNTENNKTNYKTGRELHFDIALNQYLSETFAIGLQAFHLEQYSGDSGSGAILGDFKGQVSGIGPAVLWSTNYGDQNVTFVAKWLHEFNQDNRIAGDNVYLSFVLDW